MYLLKTVDFYNIPIGGVRKLMSTFFTKKIMPYMVKAIENLRHWIDVRLVRIRKYYLKWTSKPNYMLQKLFLII